MTEETKKRVGRAIGQIPSGVSVLTAAHAGRSTGMLTSWVQQAGIDPPIITVVIKQGRPIEALIQESGHFVLNLIGEDRTAMFKQFSRGFAPDEPAFDGLDIVEMPEGVVLAGCIAHLRCRFMCSMDAGDHRIYIGEVLEGDASGAKPYVHLRANGLRY